MNQVNPKKILDSKWTAATPKDGDKHFTVTRLWWEKRGKLSQVQLTGVVTGSQRAIHWRELKDNDKWRPGWH